MSIPLSVWVADLMVNGDDKADVHYPLDIAQTAFSSLSHLWMDYRLSRNMKFRLYQLLICSTLTHSCEAWYLTKAVPQIIIGFNSRLINIITGYEYRDTVIALTANYLGHLLCLPPNRSLMAMADGGNRHQEGSLMI